MLSYLFIENHFTGRGAKVGGVIIMRVDRNCTLVDIMPLHLLNCLENVQSTAVKLCQRLQ